MYICTTKSFLMTQKVTLLLKGENINFGKTIAKKRNTSLSRMVDEYLDIIKMIDNRMKGEKLDPFVKKFSGIISTGKNEDKNSIF